MRCLGVAVLLVLAAPKVAVASEPLRLDATFMSLAQSAAAKPARQDANHASLMSPGLRALLRLGPPVRQPRRAPSDDDATATASDETAAPAPVPSASPTSPAVPSASPAVPSANPTSPDSPAAPAPGGLSPRIPSPRTIPAPEPDANAEETDDADAEPASSTPGVASSADMARALAAESSPPPAAAEAVVDTGPPQLLRGKSVPPFWIDRTWTTHRTRALTLPPLFFHRSPAAGHPDKLAHFDLSLTTGWYSKRAQKRRYFSPLALFFGSFSERTSAWGAGALLMGYKRVGEQFNFGQFPLVWHWGNKQVKNLVVVPFHYHQKTPDSLRGFDVLLFWYGRKNTTDADPLNDLRYFVGAPLFAQVTRGVKRTTIGLPLYFGGSDKLRGLTHRTVFPFVHWQSREFGNRHELWTLPYVQRSDTARKRRAWAVPPLLTFQSRSPSRSLTAVTPLVWRSENFDKSSVAWAVFPWVSYRDPEQRNRVLFPLYWQFDDLKTGARSALLFPLGGATRRPGGGFGLVLPPLLTIARHDPQGRSFQVVTPLFWRFRDRKAFGGQGSQQIVLPPLFVYNQQGPRRDVAALPLLSFFGRDATRRYQVIAPLLFGHVRERDPQRAHDTWAFGPFYFKRNAPQGVKPGWHAGLLPLVATGSDDTLRYTVIPPLLFGDVTNVKEQRRLTISPLFARAKSPDQRTLGVLNLFWDVKRSGDERHSVLFPLYYRRQLDGRTLTVTPLGGGARTKDRLTWMATPLLYGARDLSGPAAQRRRSFGLVPLVFVDRRPVDGGVASNLVVIPLFARHRAPSEDLDMWSPLVWRTRTSGEKPRKNLAVFPFYFRQRQPGGVDLDAGLVPPFFYSRDPQRRTHTLIAGPFFHRLSRTQVHTGVLPLAWWMDSVEARRLVSLPLIVHMADKVKREHTTIAVPFWFDRQRGNGKRTWVALPFVIGTHGQFNFTRFSIAPPGYVDVFRLGKNYRYTGHPLLFRYQKCGFREEDDDRCRYTLWGSFPLFLAGSDGLGRRSHGALGLYYFDRDKGGKRFYTLLGGANVRPGERLTWYALNVGRTVTRTHATTVVFPLFFRKANRTEDRSTTVALPPLFVAQRKEDYRWFEAGLLLWHFRRPHKVATAIIPPIFYSSHSFAERRLTWVAPLFLRDNNWAKDSSLTVVPPALVVQRRRGEDNDWVQFPLLWHIERGNNAGTVGLPVWWDISRKGARTQVIPGLLVRHTKKDRAVNVLGPGLGWWTRKTGKQKALHWRALFGAFGGGNEAGQRYFSLFGGRIKLKPKAVWESRRLQRRLNAPKPAAPPTTTPARPTPTLPAMPPPKPAPAPRSPGTVAPGTTPAPSTTGTVAPGTTPAPSTTGTVTPSATGTVSGTTTPGSAGTVATPTTKTPG